MVEALYGKQMSEQLCHNDETRWEVFVEIERKLGTRWYLWVTRSPSVVFYCIDPSRRAAVPGAHVAGLLEHWSGLTLLVEHPETPMDNNRAENTIRTPVNGRKNYDGSGSLWSAQLAARLFSILQSLALWGTNPVTG